MKSAVQILVAAACLFFIGCASRIGNTTFPQPAAGFVPKRTYAVPPEVMWNSVMNALEGQRILIASSDKAAGRITTDYIAGVANAYVGGIGGTSNSRYKFSISIAPVENAQTRLTILCALESSFSGSSGNVPFNNINRENPKLVANLESWLYQEIEKSLPPRNSTDGQ